MKKTMLIVVLAVIAIAVTGWYKLDRSERDGYLAPDPLSLTGSWLVKPLEGEGTGPAAGFELLPDGKALAINSDARLYKSWSFADGMLSLVVQDPGAVANAESTEVFTVRPMPLDASELILVDAVGQSTTYVREDPELRDQHPRFVPK